VGDTEFFSDGFGVGVGVGRDLLMVPLSAPNAFVEGSSGGGLGIIDLLSLFTEANLGGTPSVTTTFSLAFVLCKTGVSELSSRDFNFGIGFGVGVGRDLLLVPLSALNGFTLSSSGGDLRGNNLPDLFVISSLEAIGTVGTDLVVVSVVVSVVAGLQGINADSADLEVLDVVVESAVVGV